MTHGFSVLSLKRNRSSSNNNNNNNNNNISKLSKLKSGLSKLTNSITHYNNTLDNNNNRSKSSFIGLFQYFRNNSEENTTIDNDINYEYNQYYNNIKKNQRKSKDMERNIHTLPINATPKLTSILIKRSGTTPSSLSQSKRYNDKRNSLFNNMTINSEDLTAKEFANIAGIRILPEQQQQQQQQKEEEERKFSIEEDSIMHTLSSSCCSNYTTTTSFTYSLPNNNDLKIWDNQFWFHPEISSSRKDNLIDRKLSIQSNNNNNNILHELRRMGTRNSEKDACIIKKGRFEIQLGTTPHIINNNDHNSMNWKRKGKNPI